MPKKLRFIIYANLIICAIVLGLLCHFVSIIPAHAAEKSIVTALAFAAYLSVAITSIVNWRLLGKTFVLPEQETRASLLASLPHYQPDNPKTKEASIQNLAAEIADYIENLSQGQRAIVNYSSDLICSLNNEGKFLDLNLSAEKKWLHPNVSLLGAKFIDLVQPAERDKISSYLGYLKEGEAEAIECRMLALNSKLIDFRWKIEWSPSAQKFYCIGQDISIEKEIERLRAEITAMVSHDLRAPVSSLAYFVDGLLAGEFGNLNKLGKTQLLALRPNLDQILRLIDQLLDAEQLEAGSLKVQTKILPASSIIEAATSVLAASAKAKNIVLDFDEYEELVFADFDRCVQMMNNLLSNAIKFSPENSRIQIKCSQQEELVKFEIIDKGMGIAPEFWNQIFDRFKTLPGTKRQGAGLGLYITKKFAELQGGETGVYSVPSKGSTFWFTLRRASEADLPGYLD